MPARIYDVKFYDLWAVALDETEYVDQEARDGGLKKLSTIYIFDHNINVFPTALHLTYELWPVGYQFHYEQRVYDVIEGGWVPLNDQWPDPAARAMEYWRDSLEEDINHGLREEDVKYASVSWIDGILKRNESWTCQHLETIATTLAAMKYGVATYEDYMRYWTDVANENYILQ